MPQRYLQLGQASMTVGFEKADPIGDYKITAVIEDKVSGQEIAVTSRRKVTK